MRICKSVDGFRCECECEKWNFHLNRIDRLRAKGKKTFFLEKNKLFAWYATKEKEGKMFHKVFFFIQQINYIHIYRLNAPFSVSLQKKMILFLPAACQMCILEIWN